MLNSASNIYNASAGSGKTFTLAKSYIKILIKSENYDQFKSILAITFTNKAVGEMKVRIVNMLKLFSSEKNLSQPHPMFEAICDELLISQTHLKNKSKKILKYIIHNYGSFDISTIDGFTHRVIRTFAQDLKLPVNFEVELDTERLLNEAVDSLISKTGNDKTLTKILIDFAIEKADNDKSWDISFDFNKIAKLLTNENDLTAINSLKDKTLEDFIALKQKVITDLKTSENEIKIIVNKTLDLISESGLEHSDFSRSTLPNHFVKASNLEFKDLYKNKLEENIENRQGLYSKKLDDFLIGVIESILPQIEKNYKALKKQVYKYKFLKEVYKNLTPLSVLKAIKKELDILKSEQNKMLISEFNKIISDEIKDQPTPFIYERLGEKFKHYFIDEFQDTSKMQWENLIPLLDNALSSSNGSTMLVGDAKQAIYRWRGGEAEQFINLYNETTNPFQVKAEVLTLDTNYRSSKEIINFNNSFFQFLGDNYFSQQDYANLFKSSTQKTHLKSEGYVNLNFLDIQKDGDANLLYSNEVLKNIKQCLANGFKLNDICVLVRKRKEGISIANYLSENGINITSSETLLLTNSEKVNFITNFLKLLLQPNNNGLKVEMLSFLAEYHYIEDKHSFFLNHLKPNLNDLLESLKHLNIFINESDLLQLPLYDLVEHIIRAFKINTNSDAYLQFYLDVVLEFTQKQNSDLATFVSYFEKKKKHLSIVSPQNMNAVNIMTIHKSKGLEFPIVIFPFVDLNIYKELEPKVWFPIEREDFNSFETLLINYSKDVEHFGDLGQEIYQKHQSQLELDNINLLYVALTRAIDCLYIISKKDVTSKGLINSNTYAGMFISYLQSINKWSEDELTITFGKSKENDNVLHEEVLSEPLKFISVPKEDHNLSIMTNAGLLWDTKQEKAIERGNLVHLILSKIKTTEDLYFAFNEMLTFGELKKENSDQLKKLVLNVINHPKLNLYFKDNFKIYNEHDIITNSGQLIRPDRININSKNEAIIIDYKTGDRKAYYASQLSDYESILNQMNLTVIKKIIVYINETIDVIEV